MKMLDIKTCFAKYKSIIENFSYITLLQIFVVISPLITYPYLIDVIGQELSGGVITANVLSSYVTIVVNFGTDGVCAKYVSVNRNDVLKLSNIVSSVLVGRFLLWIVSFVLYMTVVLLVPSYRAHALVFFFTFGQSFDVLLFPQYFFQGVERMKISSLLNIGVKLVFILLIFIVVKDPSDYLLVPLCYTIGFFIAGCISLAILKYEFKIKFVFPHWNDILRYFKESSPLFATDIVCTIKDKFNYLLLGQINMGSVVVYDLGSKLTAILARPGTIIATVLFPKFAQTRNVKWFRIVLFTEIVLVLFLVLIVNIFLEQIVGFMIGEPVDIVPLRLFTISPIFLAASSFISTNFYIAFGYNRYTLYSILVTTAGYITLLLFFYFRNDLNNIYSFVIVTVLTYFIELIYRLLTCRKLLKNNHNV